MASRVSVYRSLGRLVHRSNSLPAVATLNPNRFSSSSSTKPKKKKKVGNVRADDGRIVLIQKSGKAKGNKPRLCTGCGTEVVTGSQVGITGGQDAVDSNLSKKYNKLARFLDASAATPYSSKGGTTQGFLCERCKSLKNDDVWKAYDALTDVLPEVFAKQLRHIVSRRQFGLAVLVVDATDPEHSAMKKVRNSIGKTPLWLVLNKIDLMPRMNSYDIRNLRYRIEHILGTKFIKVFAVSSIVHHGIVDLSEALLANLAGRDIFLIGAANVGKTTLVKELASTIATAIKMKGKDGRRRRDIANNLAVTGSHLPGTTLQAVRIPCFTSPGHAMWDTPGVINKKAVQYNLFPAHLMEPLARPLRIPVPTANNNLQSGVEVGYSLLVEAAWMEFESGFIHPASKQQVVKVRDASSEQVTEFNDVEFDDDLEDEAQDTEVQGEEDTPERPPPTSPRLGDPAVLGRIDITGVEHGRSIFVQAWLHPSLRVTICPTSEAPDHATIPPAYRKFIEKKTKRAVSDDQISIPLQPYIFKERPNGEFQPGEKEVNTQGKYAMDICFPSLGWLSFKHESSFKLLPHCVSGSVFSKRRAFYPSNMETQVQEEEGLIRDDLESEETGQRLREAARIGRHQNFKEINSRYRGHDSSVDMFFNDGGTIDLDVDDDEWF